MWRRLPLLAVLFSTFPVSETHGAESWSQLKLGMTAEETLATLGQPTLRTSGRGFETWIYDHGAEALLFGSLIGWTAPPSPTLVKRTVDVWQQEKPTGKYYPTFLDRVLQSGAMRAVPLRGTGIYWVPYYPTYRR